MAIEEQVRRIENTYDTRMETLHKRLDESGLQGAPYAMLVQRVVGMTGMPEFYASLVVRSYPGFASDEGEGARLKRFLELRRSLR